MDFTDARGTAESLTSDAYPSSGTVQAADSTAPTVTSIERQTPTGSPTSADTLTWRLTFSEAVENVDAADFTFTGASATLTVMAVATETGVYDVTAAGAALANLDATVTLAFAVGQNIADEAANALADTEPTGPNNNTFMLDNTAPTFVSGTANGVTLVLTFSEGLDPSSEPPGEAFDVSTIATNPAVSSVTLDGATVTLTVAPAVIAYQTVTVSNNAHMGAGFPPLRDGAGNEVAPAVDAGNYSLTNETPLGPPASLTAEAGDGRVRLVWALPEGIAADFVAYQVRHAAGASVPSATAWTGTTSVEILTALVTGLANGTAHAFEVRAARDGAVGAAVAVSATPAAAVCTLDLGGRREVWSDTMTVGRTYDRQVGVYGLGDAIAGFRRNNIGSLAGGAPRFSVGAARYNVQNIFTKVTFDDRRRLHFDLSRGESLSGPVKAALQFHFCNETKNFSDTLPNGGTEHQFTWSREPADFSLYTTRELALSLPPNNDAVGAPAVSGTARSGETLSAAIGNIADVDGLPTTFPGDYTFQWLRVDTDGVSNPVVISDAAAAAYTLTDDDVGKRVKARIGFFDRLGGAEVRDSAASAEVEAIDSTAPTVTSIERQTPAGSPTNADTLTWRVTFSEAVENVDAADFTVTGATATLTVMAVATETGVYDVTAAGAALANLDATVTLAFAVGQNIADEAANALADTEPTGPNNNTFMLDNTAPTFVSGTANGVTLVLTFSEGLDPSSEPPGEAFDVSTIATNPAVSSVTLDGATVTLTVAPAVIAYQTVTVSNNAHMGAGFPPLRDGAGNEVAPAVDAGNYSLTNETPLGPPASLTAEAGDGRVRLVWAEPEGIARNFVSYQIRHAAGASVPSATAWTGTANVQILTALVTGLANGTAHAFEVRAVRGGVAGAAAAVSATPAAAVCTLDLGGRREVWSDTLTVGRSFQKQVGVYGMGDTRAGFVQNNYGSLAGGAPQFSVGAARYNVSLIRTVVTFDDRRMFGFYTNKNQEFSGPVRAALRFHFCNETRNFSDTNFSGSIGNQYLLLSQDADFSLYTTRELALSLPPNNDATGAPAVSGTARTHETLTAAIGNIADTDGLPTTFPGDYTFQWLRVDTDGISNPVVIADAAASAYTLTHDDAGKRVKVRIGFLDQLGGAEVRDSAASAEVEAVANNPPEFPAATADRSVAENTAAGQDVGAAVTATDDDTGDTLDYTLGGADAASFDIVATSGQIRTRTGVTYDHETNASYSVTVTASDGTDTDAVTVTITVTDVNEPPGRPSPPALTATAGSGASLDVSWAAPANTGPAIASYDLQYRQAGSGPFTAGPQDVTGLSAAIGSLLPKTIYQVQVRAGNAEGDGRWSPWVAAETNNSAGALEISGDWNLKPTALVAGDRFRLLFLSSGKRNAEPTDIATYNTWIQAQVRATAGHADIQAYNAGFRAVGCTADSDARDNTATTYTNADKGVPIYWLGGARAAEDYEDFYDGSWEDEVNDKNESGADGPDTSQLANYPLTGCDDDGTEKIVSLTSSALGTSDNLGSTVGRPNSSGTGHGPLTSGFTTKTGTRPMYGLSALFQVAAGRLEITVEADAASVVEGTAAAFTLRRTGAATAGLEVAIAVTQEGETLSGTAPTSATFAAGMATVMLSMPTLDDEVDEADGAVTVTLVADTGDPAAYALGNQSVAVVTVTDDDMRGLTISPMTLTVIEGMSNTYTVALTSAPTGAVTITPSSNNADVTVSPETLAFTAADWSTAQTVRAAAAQDADTDDARATVAHGAAGADYGANSVSASLTVTVEDDDADTTGSLPTDTGGGIVLMETHRFATNLIITWDPNQTTRDVFGTGSHPGGYRVVDFFIDFSGSVPGYSSWIVGPGLSGDANTRLSNNGGELSTPQNPMMTLQPSQSYTYTQWSSSSRDLFIAPTSSPTGLPGWTVNAASLISSAFEMRIRGAPVLGAPLNFAVAPSADGSAAITWSPVQNAATGAVQSYHVETCTANCTEQANWAALKTFTAMSDSYSLTHRGAPGGTRQYRVRAFNGLFWPYATAQAILVSTPPRVVSIERRSPASTPTNANSLSWRVRFNENVANVDLADFTVSGTTAALSVREATAATVYDVTATGGNLDDLNATVTLGFASNHDITDTAGNALTDTAPTGANDNTFVVDNTRPAVTITGVPMTSFAPFTATFTFLEAVTGFAGEDITVGNGAASAFAQTDPMTYTALITPATDGAVTVDVAANAATDAAGNGNPAAARASSTYTFTLPSLSISVDNENIAENGGTAIVTFSTLAPFQSDRTITLRLLHGTARENTHFRIASKSLLLSAGETSVSTTITAIDNGDDEDDKTVIVRFSLASGGNLLEPDRVTVTIVDDDIGNLVSFGADTYTTTEGESPVQVTLTLSRAPSSAVDIPLFVQHGGGAGNSDYSGIPRTLRFSTTDTSSTFAVTATDDTVNDDGESVTIVLGTLPTGFNAGSPASTTVNLNDDEELSIQGDVRGKPVVGQTLTADTSGITDGNGLGEFSYRWLRDGADTVRRGSTLTLTEQYAGRRISVRVTFTDGIGNSETRTSPRTSRVIMPIRKLVGTGAGSFILLGIGDIPENRRAWSQGFLTGANEQGYMVEHFSRECQCR